MVEVNYPITIEGRIAARVKKIFTGYLADKKASIQANLRRQDDATDRRFYEQFENGLRDQISSAEPAFKALFTEMHQHGAGQFAQLFKWEFGADPILNEPWHRQIIDDAAKDLIKKLHGTAGGFAEKARQSTEAARRGQGGTIGRANDEISKHKKEAVRNAVYHVRDVSGTLMHDLTFRRFEDFGIEEYEWVTRLDKHVRGRPDGLYPHSRHNHWSRHGEIYSNTDRLSDGRPGEPSACRCIAKPVFPDYGRKPSKTPGWLLAFLAGVVSGAANEAQKPA